jgi:hypothetical protein
MNLDFWPHEIATQLVGALIGLTIVAGITRATLRLGQRAATRKYAGKERVQKWDG